MPPEQRPLIEVFVRSGLNDGYASCRLDVTLSSLQAVQARGVGVAVTLWLSPEDGIDPILNRFCGLQPRCMFEDAVLHDRGGDLSFALVAKQPYFMVLNAGSIFPLRVSPSTLFDGNRAVIRAATTPDLSGVRRAAALVGGVSSPNDIQVHDGLFVYSTKLAERAHLMLSAMHGSAFLNNEASGLGGPRAYVAINDDRLEGWHSVRRSAEAPLLLSSSPDVRMLRSERALDRIYAQLSMTA